ncbi:hypothetical protein ACE4NS_000798 [Campylobacter coli]
MADLEQVVNDLNLASQSLQELREKYDGALDLLDNKNTQITGAIDSAKSNALQEIQTISDTATSQISQLKNTSLNLVNEAKNTAIEEVNNAVSGIDTSKEEALLAIEQAKAAQEEKITDLEQAKENIITELSEKAKLLTQNLEWTVGTGGKFKGLQEAINEAAKYINNKDYTLKLKLISNIETNNSIYIRKLNIPFVDIDFNGFKVKINSKAMGFLILSSKIGKILKPYVESYRNCFNFLNSTCQQIGLSDTSYTCKLSCSAPNISVSNPIAGIHVGTGSAVIFMGKFQFLTPDTNKHCFTSSGGGVLSYRHPSEVIQSSGVAFNILNGGFISNMGVKVTGGASKNSQTPNVVSESGIIFG